MKRSGCSNSLLCWNGRIPTPVSWAHRVDEDSSVGVKVACLLVMSDCFDLDAFKRKVQETGKPCSDFNPDGFFRAGDGSSSSTASTESMVPMSVAPPRLVSDQMVNIFFQEWSPLFPVLHRPTFLKLYEDYTANPESIDDKHSIAQLNLVFGIAALSAEVRLRSMVQIVFA